MYRQMTRLEVWVRDWKASLHVAHKTPIATRFATCAAHAYVTDGRRIASSVRVDCLSFVASTQNAPGEHPVPSNPTPFSTRCASHSCGEQNPISFFSVQKEARTEQGARSTAKLRGQGGRLKQTYKTTLWKSAIITPRKVRYLTRVNVSTMSR